MRNEQTLQQYSFDPSDYPAFCERVRSAVTYDPFENSFLKEIFMDAQAVEQLPGILQRIAPARREVLVVMDKTPMKRENASLKPLVHQVLADAGYQLTTIELEGDHFGVVHPDFEQVEIVHSHITPKKVVLGLGSGVVADICKYACFLFDQEHPTQHLPLISFPTANSAPAFSSAMSIISKDGVKRTWRTRLPDIIVYDLKVLRDSPHALTLGGFGDMCAMYIASLEWYLGIYMGVIADSPASRSILQDARSMLVDYAEEIGRQTLSGMQMLAKILTLGGLAMTFAGDSTPMSGYEHGMAHLLDMGAEHFNRPIRNHGSQVAVAGIFVLKLLERFLDELDPDNIVINDCYPDDDTMEKRILNVFSEIDSSGAMGAECWRDYHKKLVIWRDVRPQFEHLISEWPDMKQKMKEMILPSQTYVNMLRIAGHPLTFTELDIPETEARWAFRNAFMLRKRLSMTDLMIFMDWLNDSRENWLFSEVHKLIKQIPNDQPIL